MPEPPLYGDGLAIGSGLVELPQRVDVTLIQQAVRPETRLDALPVGLCLPP